MRINLCNDFIKQSKNVWNWLRKSFYTKISISEESITDFILLELQYKHPKEIKTQKYTKPQESRTGADWEWWLTSGKNWLGLRVQAKKLDPKRLEYPELDKRNAYGLQVNLLINYSLNGSPKRIPLYVLYNFWKTDNYSPQWNCRYFQNFNFYFPNLYFPNVSMLGCSIVDAQTIKNVLNKGSKKLQDIAPFMYPWSCLVCCMCFSPTRFQDLPNRAFDFIKGAFRFDFNRDDFIVIEPPYYVYKILKREELTEGEWENIVGTDISRITIIREERSEIEL